MVLEAKLVSQEPTHVIKVVTVTEVLAAQLVAHPQHSTGCCMQQLD